VKLENPAGAIKKGTENLAPSRVCLDWVSLGEDEYMAENLLGADIENISTVSLVRDEFDLLPNVEVCVVGCWSISMYSCTYIFRTY
jgi:hypothetical protein